MLVREVIDRAFLEWLYPGGAEHPAFDFLDGGIDQNALTLTLLGRVERVPRDSVLEVGNELMLVAGGTGRTVNLASRGHLGSPKTSHATGAMVRIDPPFTRWGALQAIRGIMVRLWGWGIYSRHVFTTTFTTAEVITLPAGARDVISVVVTDPSANESYTRLGIKGRDFIVYKEFDPVKVHLRRPGAEGVECQIIYISDPGATLPTSESDDLSQVLSPMLQEGLPMAAAGHMLRGHEPPRVLLERLLAQLQAQNVPVTAALNVGEALIAAFRRDYVAAERRRLSELDEPAFEWVR